MAVSLEAVRASNAKVKLLKSGLVAVFVGGTSGIGEAALRAFAQYAKDPKIYLVGRNETAASKITEDVRRLNAESNVHFIKADTSLLRNVDIACREIQEKEDKVNLLFLTTGYLTFSGRQETTEGIDRKFCLNYYSRFRFVHNLLPQLSAASTESNSISRVISVLGPGSEGNLVEDDLDLQRNFSLGNCASHAIIFSDFACEELAKANPGTTFMHLAPGALATGAMDHGGFLLKAIARVLFVVFRPFFLSLPESGERNVFHATSDVFTPSNKRNENSAMGSDGVRGSGAYLINWNSKATGNPKILGNLRKKEFGARVWEHTLQMFSRADA